MLVKMGKWIAKHKVLICILGFLLIIPSVLGIIKTRINYDLLSYLPDTLETVSGQDILVDEFGMGAFSMVVVEDMEMKDVQKLEEQLSEVEHVKDVLWYDDVADITLPVEMIPENKCVCKEFREQIADPDFEGYCHCMLFYKSKD